VFRGRCSSLHYATVSPDGRLLAGTDANTIRLWELPSGKERPDAEGVRAGVEWVAVSPDGKAAASLAPGQRGVLVWDVGTGKVSAQLRLLAGYAGGLAFAGWPSTRRVCQPALR
jgi:WD40 repeat protein